MSSINRSILMALALAGANMHMPALVEPTIQVQQRRTKAIKHAGFNLSTGQWSYPARDGWSVAAGKRMATKRRNKARHRAATKGK